MEKVIYIMRGISGSGKSTLALKLCNGVKENVCSTDDFFIDEDGKYNFDTGMLQHNHGLNQERAEEKMEQGISPLAIDNTHTQTWEAKPYVEMAQKYGYKVEFKEPETSWKFDAQELAKRNVHGVPFPNIQRMLQRYVPMSDFTIEAVLRSKSPAERNKDKRKSWSRN